MLGWSEGEKEGEDEGASDDESEYHAAGLGLGLGLVGVETFRHSLRAQPPLRQQMPILGFDVG